jgi:hypothetical protein
MASYKSQFVPPRRIEDRVPTTRLPQRSVTPVAHVSQLPSASQSKLQKRRPSRDERMYPTRGSSNQTEPPMRVSSRQGSIGPAVPAAASFSKTNIHSTSRLPKLEVPTTIHTPSLFSGSSASTIESPRSNVLRRKKTNVGMTGSRQTSQSRSDRDDSMSSQEGRQPFEGFPGGYKDPFSETVLGISLPSTSVGLAHAESDVEGLHNNLYDYEIGPLDILPLPTPQYALSATPSTRYSESPGAFSISSTATSMTSYSPGHPLSKTSTRVRQVSPLQGKMPVSRLRDAETSNTGSVPGLSTVRESSTSSSSTSTVLADASSRRLPTLPQSAPVKPSAAKPRFQAPPELAHLADQSPVSPPALRRPSRPSRDGTPEIVGLRDPSPIVQSNMSSFPTAHRRTSSMEVKFGLSSMAKGRSATPVSRVPTRGTTPDDQRDHDSRRSSTLPAPTPAPSPGKTSRFGFFARRTKTEPTAPTAKSNKLSRRGPAAGTGHEGYGKHAPRDRSNGSISTASIGRSASAGTTSESLVCTPSSRKSSFTSTTSSEMDDFFLNRLAPKIIRGAGSSTELTRSPEPMDSSSSLDLTGRPKYAMGNTTSITAQPVLTKTKPTLLPSAMPNAARAKSPMKKSRKLSESDDDSKQSFLPTLSSRRTSRVAKSAENTTASQTGRSASKGRKDSASDMTSDGRDGKWLKSSKKVTVEKKEQPKSSRWNFFQRAHAAPRVEQVAVEANNVTNQVPASRSVAHYALGDADSGLTLEDIEQLMKEAAGTPDTGSVFSDNESVRKERMHSILLPPKPILPASVPHSRPASPQVVLRSEQSPQRYMKLTVNTDVQTEAPASHRQSQAEWTPIDLSPPSSPFREHTPKYEIVSPKSVPVSTPSVAPHQSIPVSNELPLASNDFPPVLNNLPPVFNNLPPPGPPPASPPPRPSRLPQVGRIPHVISSRRQPRGPSSQSFSRPFVANQPRPTALPRTSFDSIGSVFATAGPAESYPILRGLDALSHGSAIATINPVSDEFRQSEFFKFPPRKGSEASYSSSSGVWSFSPTVGTAIVPAPEAPLSDDELWNEYDDLLDEVISPINSRDSGGETTRSHHPSLEPLPLNTKLSLESCKSEDSIYEASNPSMHLRRSRLLAVLHSAQSPTSSIAMSDFLNQYGEQKLSVVDPLTGRLSLAPSPHMSLGSAPRRSTRSTLPVSLAPGARQSGATVASKSDRDRESASTNRYRSTQMMELAETHADGLVSMANLRFGALMTSKWLSFGRVLFSPVHFQLKDPSEDRVLVIDGLGKDWSFYCALTYAEASVYDIGPEPSSSTDNSSEQWSTLRNHRHIRHSALTNALPYPSNFFACVVLRFPTALPSSVHRFVLSEAKRVLRPGGYIEFSVLDLDLVNMGNRARRAVRGLKMKIQEKDESISLRNISDEIMAGLGRKGFTECNRCVVGIPVAGQLCIPNEAAPQMAKRKESTASSTTTTLHPPKDPTAEMSFSDLLNVSSPSESTNNGIADMVARVGRWWYSRCYESIILPAAEEAEADLLKNSIWRDESLIAECEKRGTSFRLLIGYAQKPEVGVRRTVSV